MIYHVFRPVRELHLDKLFYGRCVANVERALRSERQRTVKHTGALRSFTSVLARP